MLPTLRVKSLLTVAEDQYLSETARHRENKAHEMQADRDLAGFYVYQSYLRRLRRLHKNYVRKYRALQQQQMLQKSQQQHMFTQGDTPLRTTNPFASSSFSNGDWPTRTNFRVSLNQSQDPLPTVRSLEDPSESLVLPPIIASHDSDEDSEEERDVGSKGRPIYIPCGRESSFIAQEKLKRQKRGKKDKSGALSFRLWRNKYGHAQTPYSSSM